MAAANFSRIGANLGWSGVPEAASFSGPTAITIRFNRVSAAPRPSHENSSSLR